MHTQDELYISTDVSHYHKYKGLLKRSNIKNYRDVCFRFFDYLYTMASSHERIVSIMCILHYIQVSLIALCPLSNIFWPKDSVLGKIINIFAIVVNLCTPQSSEIAHITIALILYSFIALFLLFLLANIIIFHKYTKVNQHIINFICIVLNAFLPYFVLCIGSNIGREISVISKYYLKKITYVPESDNEIILQFSCFSIGIFLEIILFIIQLLFVTPVLTFRPQSIHFINSRSMFCYLGSYFLMSVILSSAGGLNNYIILFCTAIPIIFLHLLTYSHIEVWGTFEFRELSLCVLETISILLFIEYFLLIFRIQINEILLLSIILFFTIFYYRCSIQGIKSRQKFLILCDRIISEPQIFEQLNENNAITLLRIGFEMGHKICHNWSAFDYADKQFPNNRRILLLLLRYATFYPEEHLILRIIINKVQRHKKHDIELKFLLFQLYSLYQQRERGLSKSLKKMLEHLDNKTNKCRSQISSIWTSVIQGNISGIENLTLELKKNAEEITREYNQLCISYPNNPYVASSFSAFLSDIWCKEKESMIFKRIYRLLRNGGKTRIDKSFYFARLLFPSLPAEDQHKQMNRDEEDENEVLKPQNRNNTANSIVSISVDNFYEVNEEITDEKSQHKYLETMVETIRFSSLRYGPILIFFIISIFFPLISIVFSIVVSNRMDANINGVKLIEKESLQRSIVSQISIAFYYYVLNSNRLINSFYEILSLKATSLNHLLSLSKYCEDLLNEINLIFPSLFETGYFDKTLNFLFDDSIYASRVFSNYSYGVFKHSYEFYITLVGESVLRAAPMKAIKLLNMTDFWTVVFSCSDFLRYFDFLAEIQLEEMNGMIEGNYWKCFKMVLGVGVVSLIVFFIVSVFVFKKMSIEKEVLFSSFKSLPKSAVSATITKINAQLGKYEEDQTQTFLSTQEEGALRALTMNKERSIAKSTDSFVIAILCIFLVCVVANFFFIIYSQKVVIDKLPQLCEVMLTSSAVHSSFAEIILTQARIVSYGQKQIPFNSLHSKSELINLTYSLFEKLDRKIHLFRFGGGYISHGLFGFGIDFFTEIFNQTANCTTEKDDRDFVQCISLENSMSYVNFILNGLFIDITQKPDSQIPLNQRALEVSIRWLFNTSFPEFVSKFGRLSVKKATSLHYITKTYFLILPLVILSISVIACGISIFPRLVRNGESAKWALRLLLFCPPSVVLQSRPIIKIMSNDFSIGDENDQDKGQFFEKVVSRMRDASIFIDNQLVVRCINYEFLRLFGNKIGTSLFDLFISPSDDNSSVRSFTKKLRQIGDMEMAPSFEGEITVMVNVDDEIDGSEKLAPKVFHFILIGVDTSGKIQKIPVLSDSISFFSLILCDLTDKIEEEAKLALEKAKIEKILCHSLPPRILSEYLNKSSPNISYNVESCSIVVLNFFEIRRLMVNISPSTFLMSFKSAIQLIEESLNLIGGFVRLPSFTDLFVVAFGVLDDEEESSLSHQKRAVIFALESISKINSFNRSEEGQIFGGLRLSVGMSCGGPVVAGIVNLSAPTFSVVGWPFKLAADLSRSSPPMHAQLPRAMYDDAFDVNDDVDDDDDDGEFDESRLVKEEADVEFDEQLLETYILCENEELN